MELVSLYPAYYIKDNQWAKTNGIQNKKFIVEYYQRGYRWEKKNADKLLQDMKQYFDKIYRDFNTILDYVDPSEIPNDRQNDFDFYCLQALSVKFKDKQTYELIDGQQRLTTFFVLYTILTYFLFSSEERPNRIYDIIYDRGDENLFNLSEYLYRKIPNEINGIYPIKAYKLPHSTQEEKDARDNWFDQYKTALKKSIMATDTSDMTLAGNSLTIDLYYIGEVTEQIIDFIKCYPDAEQDNKYLRRYFDFLKWNVLFLWYEISLDMSAEKEFVSLNTNKIDLTNAELIKALVLKKGPDGSEEENAANRWEAIEQGLCQSELWAFISDDNKATKIDLLLDILAHSFDDAAQDLTKERDLFDWYEKYSSNFSQNEFSKLVIDGIEDIYSRICEWYSDVEIYHYIGLLTCYRSNLKLTDNTIPNQEALIKAVFNNYSQSVDRDDFIKKLKSMIRKCLLHGIPRNAEPEHMEDIVTNNIFSYENSSDRNNIMAILWYLNAWETIDASDNNNTSGNNKKERKTEVIRRLPFSKINGDLSKKCSWTLEHVMPQNPKNYPNASSSDDQDSYDRLINEINENDKANVVSDTHVNEIGNLALLMHSTNAMIHNSNLETKRIELAFADLGKGNFLPPATVNVFGNYYFYYYFKNKTTTDIPSSLDSKYWTNKNKEWYEQRLKDCLSKLNPESEGQGVD